MAEPPELCPGAAKVLEQWVSDFIEDFIGSCAGGQQDVTSSGDQINGCVTQLLWDGSRVPKVVELAFAAVCEGTDGSREP